MTLYVKQNRTSKSITVRITPVADKTLWKVLSYLSIFPTLALVDGVTAICV